MKLQKIKQFLSPYSESDNKDAKNKLFFFIGFIFLFVLGYQFIENNFEIKINRISLYIWSSLFINSLFIIQRIRFLGISYLFLLPVVLVNPITQVLHLLFLLLMNKKARIVNKTLNLKDISSEEEKKIVITSPIIKEEYKMEVEIDNVQELSQDKNATNKILNPATKKWLISYFWMLEWFPLKISRKGFILWCIIIFPISLIHTIGIYIPEIILAAGYFIVIINLVLFPIAPLILLFMVLFLPIVILILGLRLKDAGKPPILALLIVIPYVGPFIQIVLLAYAAFLKSSDS